MTIHIRNATADDAELIFHFITELAIYEREPDAVEVTPAVLRDQLSENRPPFECVIAELDGAPAGFALFFANYSTWRGRPGIYLEDLFVPRDLRGRGVGFALLKHLAGLVVARGGARLEWAVLDWNQPAIDFYERIGARQQSDWITMRLTNDALERLAC